MGTALSGPLKRVEVFSCRSLRSESRLKEKTQKKFFHKRYTGKNTFGLA